MHSDSNKTHTHLRIITTRPSVVTLELDRPQVRHALDAVLLDALATTIESLSGEVRVVCIVAQGPVFCAGADLSWMKDVGPEDDTTQDARRLDRVFAAIEAAPQIFVACVQGPAIGGGAGLAAACDFVLASHEASFAFAEVRLGLVAATIAPFVVARMGHRAAKAALLLGARITAPRAHALGLVDFLAPPDELDSLRESIVDQLLLGGPRAQAATQALLRALESTTRTEQRELSHQAILAARQSDEGQQGMAAFFAREPAPWCRK